MFLLTSLLFCHIFTTTIGGECEDKGGQCVDWRYYVCHAGVETGICPGDTNIRCCLDCDQTCLDNETEWSGHDGACEGAGGECKLNSNYCDGTYQGGMCGGPPERQCCTEGGSGPGGCPKIISREEWGAIYTNCNSYMDDYRPYLFVHHAESNPCSDISSCSQLVRGIQDWHINGNGWCDIGYSFLVGGDGNVYEGRGWNQIGAHTYGFNSQGYGVCFLGDFMNTLPTSGAENVFHDLAACMMDNGKINSGYELKGHRQAVNTECPGDALYKEIQSWPHWTPGYIGYKAEMTAETEMKLNQSLYIQV